MARRAGYTLIEMVAAIGMSGVVMATAVGLLLSLFRLDTSSREHAATQSAGELVLRRVPEGGVPIEIIPKPIKPLAPAAPCALPPRSTPSHTVGWPRPSSALGSRPRVRERRVPTNDPTAMSAKPAAMTTSAPTRPRTSSIEWTAAMTVGLSFQKNGSHSAGERWRAPRFKVSARLRRSEPENEKGKQ